MMGWLARMFGGKRQKVVPRGMAPRAVRLRYDAAQTTDENRRHWAGADTLSALAANSESVRILLRSRARYEVANNSYARGIVLTLGNDTVGTGPRLQLTDSYGEANQKVESLFNDWAQAVSLAEKLRTLRMAKAESGEVFVRMVTNPMLPTPCKLDIELVECDRVTSPWDAPMTANEGIEYDAYGNPRRYYVLRNHPGDAFTWMPMSSEYDIVPADLMLHYFSAVRPGQTRGIPDITPALPLFAQLRRYTLAVLAAAETAADFAAVMYTDAPAAGVAAELTAAEMWTSVELERRMATILPEGWKLGQVTPEQPATTYAEFKRELLNEIARCLNMPFNVAAGNSSGYNYSSGRLDHQTYYKSISIDQSHIERCVLNPILSMWFKEAMLISGMIPPAMRIVEGPPRHQWFWDGMEHVDPAKEAEAQGIRLTNMTTTLAAEYAKQGKDWETELRQRAREKKLMDELGLTPAASDKQPVPVRRDPGIDEDEARGE